MTTKAMWPERTVTSLDGSRSAVIPAMPEVADAMEPPSHAGNWLWKHYDNVENSYRNQDSLEPYPPPLTKEQVLERMRTWREGAIERDWVPETPSE